VRDAKAASFTTHARTHTHSLESEEKGRRERGPEDLDGREGAEEIYPSTPKVTPRPYPVSEYETVVRLPLRCEAFRGSGGQLRAFAAVMQQVTSNKPQATNKQSNRQQTPPVVRSAHKSWRDMAHGGGGGRGNNNNNNNIPRCHHGTTTKARNYVYESTYLLPP
jgi:hypothetical protein